MATNLISTISQVLTPELLTRIASALGLDRYARREGGRRRRSRAACRIQLPRLDT